MTYQDLEARRREAGISRAEMCRRAGISESTVTKGLNEGRTPSNPIAKALADVLDAAQKAAAA